MYGCVADGDNQVERGNFGGEVVEVDQGIALRPVMYGNSVTRLKIEKVGGDFRHIEG